MRRERPSGWRLVTPLGWIAGLVIGLVLGSRLVPRFYDSFVGPYIWQPLVSDQGFNVVNTLLSLVVLAFMGTWLYRLLKWHGVRVEIWLILAGLHVQPAGAMLRALEDSDYFAPYDERVAEVRPDLGAGASCVAEVGGSLVDQCLGLAFITPIIYIWILLLVSALGVLALEAQRVGRVAGLRRGRQYIALTFAGLFALYLAWYASGPRHVRIPVPPWWTVLCLGAAGLIILGFERRLGRHDWRATYFAYNTAFFLWVSYLVALWIGGGAGAWRPTEARPFLVPLGLLAASAFAATAAGIAALLVRGRKNALGIGASWILVTTILVAAGLAVFIGVTALVHAFDPRAPEAAHLASPSWFGAALTILGLAFALTYRIGRSFGAHPSLRALLDPFNLLLIGSQFLDALMTSVGLDLYGATEKHVLPRTLVVWVDSLALPAALEPFPTMLAFIPYKLVLTLLLVWAVDVRFRDHFAGRANLAQIVKGVALIVGFSPGLRDAIRLGMGV